MTEGGVGGAESVRAESPRLSIAPGGPSFDWILTGLTGLIALGGYLIVKGGKDGTLAGETLASAPALVLYAGAVPAVVMLLSTAATGRATNVEPRVTMTAPHRGAVVGAILFVAGFVVALLEVGSFDGDVVRGLVSPGALLLAAGATLIASGPVLSFAMRVANERQRDGRQVPRSGIGLAVASAWLLAIPMLFVAVAHPWVTGAGLALSPDPPFATHADLYAIPLTRSGSVRLTATPDDDEVHPAVHPDGTRIAIARGRLEALDIWMLGIDGTEIGQVTDTPDANEDGLTWSPDGTRLAWWSDRMDEARRASEPGGASAAPRPNVRADAPAAPRTEASVFDTWIGDADGADPQRIALPDTDDGVESWSPDGGRLCGWLTVDGEAQVHTFGLDGSAPVRVTSVPGEAWSCAWSPSGGRLAFHSLRDGDYEIWTIAPDGSDERRLTDNDAMDMLPRWSPDGERIAFISDSTGEIEIHTMAADGSDVRNVSQDPALDDGIYGIDWTPDGTSIIAASAGRPYAPAEDASLRAAFGAIAVMAVVIGLVVGLVLRYRPMPGTFTLAFALTGLLVAYLGDSAMVLLAFLASGIAADALGAWPSLRSAVARAPIIAGLSVALLIASTFIGGRLEGPNAWDGELVVAVTLLAGLVAAACAALAARPGSDVPASGATGAESPA